MESRHILWTWSGWFTRTTPAPSENKIFRVVSISPFHNCVFNARTPQIGDIFIRFCLTSDECSDPAGRYTGRFVCKATTTSSSHRPGTSIANADALSRLPLPETVEVSVPEPVTTPGERSCDSNNDQRSDEDRSSFVTCDAVRVTTLAWEECSWLIDAVLQATTRTVLRGWMYLMGYKSHYTNNPSLRANERTTSDTSWCFTHEESGKKVCGWPSMDADLEAKMKNCHSCQLNQHAPAKAPSIDCLWTLRILSWDTCS